MPKSSNQKLKLLYLAIIFLESTDSAHALTLKELSASLARYEIKSERKCLYDDIECLRVFGLDICVTRDKSVRYYVGEHTLDTTELGLLVDAVRGSDFLTERRSVALVKKLEGLVSRHEASSLRKQSTAVSPQKADNEEMLYNLNMIRRAIAEDRRIGFKYFSLGMGKKRVLCRGGELYDVSPLTVCKDVDGYAVFGIDHTDEALRSFRLDRMMELYIDRSKREGSESFDLESAEERLRYGFGVGEGELCHVRLSCDSDVADAIFDRFGKDVVVANFASSYELTVKDPLTDGFYSWVLGQGGKVRVLTPDNVRAHVEKLAYGVIEKHRK